MGNSFEAADVGLWGRWKLVDGPKFFPQVGVTISPGVGNLVLMRLVFTAIFADTHIALCSRVVLPLV